MKIPSHFFKNVIALIIIASLTNCAVQRDNRVPEVAFKDIQFSSDKKIKIFVDWRTNGTALSNQKVTTDIHNRVLRNMITNMKCCILVDKQDEADVTLEGSFRNESDDAALLYYATTRMAVAAIVPAWVNIKSHIQANVGKDKKTYNYDLQDSLLSVSWLPLMFAFPFTKKNPITAEGEMNQNLYTNLLLKMKEEGIFSK